MSVSKMPEPAELAAAIRAVAASEGFIACGFAPAVDSQGFTNLVKWIDAGFAAEMNYFADRLDAYRHPRGVLPGARSVIALAYPYPALDPTPIERTPRDATDLQRGRTFGRVARYTWPGNDYHDVIHPKLKRVCHEVRDLCPETQARGIVDTAPLMEREVAQLAGLGWRGKNTLLLNRNLGSYFFLACVLVDIDFPADAAFEADHCGTCTACLDACPTDAFVQPHVLDASKCISYLTIESRELTPEPLREKIGDWVFGCDVCQEVCPWNRKPTRHLMSEAARADSAGGTTLDSQRGRLEVTHLFSLDDDAFREQFRGTAMWRTKRRGLLRNAAIVIGNEGRPDSIDALMRGLSDTEPMVRAACVWAIRQIAQREELETAGNVNEALKQVQRDETDPLVLVEFD